MAADASGEVRRTSSTGKRSGKHRAKPKRIAPYTWLGAGAVTVGVGAALVAGAGQAGADTGRSDTTSSESAATKQSSPSRSAESAASPERDESDSESASEERDRPGVEQSEISDYDPEKTDDEDGVEADAHEVDDESDGDETVDGAQSSAEHASPEAPEETQTLGSDLSADTLLVASTGAVFELAATELSSNGATEVSDAIPVQRPVTLQAMVVDVLHWVGLSALAYDLPVPALPVPTFVESLWLAVREHQYKWNNQRPVARVNISAQDPDSGVITGSLNATDFDDSRLTFFVTTDPQNGTVVVDSGGNFTYTPASAMSATGGVDTFVITIDDRVGNPTHYHGLLGLVGLLSPTAARIRVSVSPFNTNRSPVAGTPAYSYTLDVSSGAITGSVNVTDPDGDPLRYTFTTTIDQEVGSVSLDAQTGAWTFTPTDGARHDAWRTAGTDTVNFTVSASDGTDVVAIVVTAPVVPSNAAPEAGTPNFAVIDVDDATGIVTGVVNVVEPEEDPLAYSVVGTVDSAIGSVAVDAMGLWTFTPTTQARQNAWDTEGVDQIEFGIRATDGDASVTITVFAPIAPQQPADDGSFTFDKLRDLVESGDLELIHNGSGIIETLAGNFTKEKVLDSADAADLINRLAPLLGAATGAVDASQISVNRIVQPLRGGGEYVRALYRVQPTIDGVKVLGGDIVLTTDGSGSVTALYNYFDKRISAVETAPDPRIDTAAKAQAVATAALLRDVNGELDEDELQAVLAALSYDSELVVYGLDSEVGPVLAWRVTVYTPSTGQEYEEPGDDEAEAVPTPIVNATYYIYANGAKAATILTAEPSFEGAYALDGSFGKDLRGRERTLVVESQGGTVRLIDPLRKIETFISGSADDRGKLAYKRGFTLPWEDAWDRSAVSAHANTAIAYDFFKYDLGFEAFARNGGRLRVMVIPTLNIIAGFGSTDSGGPLIAFGHDSEGALDVVAHELTHAAVHSVTAGTGFGKGREAEALEEALGDIIGSLVEYTRGTDISAEDRFMVGQDIPNVVSLGGGCVSQLCALRFMADPAMLDPSDRGEVSEIQTGDNEYQVSTIFSRAAARMMQDPRTEYVTAEMWGRVFFNATSVMGAGPGSAFERARTNVVIAARDQGFVEDELKAIHAAFDSVGIKAVPRLTTIEGTPLNLAVNANGRYLYTSNFIANPGTAPGQTPGLITRVAETDTLTGATVYYDVADNLTPLGMGTSPSGRFVYVLGSVRADPSQPGVVVVYDTFERAVVGQPIRVGNNPLQGDVLVSPDGSKVYVAAVSANGSLSSRISVIDAINNAVARTVSLDGYVSDLMLSADGKRLYATSLQFSQEGTRPVVSIFNTTDNSLAGTVALSDSTGALRNSVDMVASTDNARLYVAVRNPVAGNNDYSILVYDTASGALVDTFDAVGSLIGSMTVRGHFMALSPDGRRLYVTDSSLTSLDPTVIKVIDIRTGNFVDSLELASGLYAFGGMDMVVASDKKLYLSGQEMTGEGVAAAVFGYKIG